MMIDKDWKRFFVESEEYATLTVIGNVVNHQVESQVWILFEILII
jgi:hypothetical protein